MASLKEKILAADDMRMVPVEIPEWDNETVYLKPVSAAQWDLTISEIKRDHFGKIENKPNWRAWLVCQVLCEQDGTRVFSDQDAGMLGKKSSVAVQRLFDKLAEMNGLSEKDAQELEKNSEATPAVSSPSDLELS